MASNIRARDDLLEGDLAYVEAEQIEEDEEEEDEDVNIGAYEDEIYGKLLIDTRAGNDGVLLKKHFLMSF